MRKRLSFTNLNTLFFCTFLITGTALMSQTSRGAIGGTVTDATGAAITTAKVSLIDQQTAVKREVTTSAAGSYRFDALNLSTYSLSVEAPGFVSATAKDMEVTANHTINLDFSLKPGAQSESVTVDSATAEVLQTTEQVRGDNFETRSITRLPVANLDPLNVMALVPGAQTTSAGAAFSNGTNYSINGQRSRANNFMIDGADNNDISVEGPAYQITNPDAVQEVSVQTSNFSAEFGRAGGAVVNEITRSGTNNLHGTIGDYFNNSAFNATSNNDRIGKKPTPRLVEHLPSFTVGGPVTIPHLYDGRDKTFFFAAGQWDRRFQTGTLNVRIPTPAGLTILQSLAGSCPNVALYLKALGDLRADPSNSPSKISIAAPAGFPTCNGSSRAGMAVETGVFTRSQSEPFFDNNHTIKIDHRVSARQQLSFRWLYDSSIQTPNGFNNLSGFDNNFTGLTLDGQFTDSFVFNPTTTNEFRFNYGRLGLNFPSGATDTFHQNLQNYVIGGSNTTTNTSNFNGFGVATNIPQYRYANNWQYQDTVTKVIGKHTLRIGADFLRQLAKQHPPFNERGSFLYSPSSGATALSNFIDDVAGNGGNTTRQFGVSIYYPNLLRQSYFVQDSWKTTSSLTLNLGLRYENFGQPVNIFNVGGFTEWDPVNFAAPHKVHSDNNNFGPSVGFAWNPKAQSGLAGHVLGDGKTVLRGGFQISYDAQFNNLLSNIAGSSPNTLGGVVTSTLPKGSTDRGTVNLSGQFGTILPTPATALSPQSNLLDPNIVNPYTMHTSLGIQRELPAHLMFDLSYVGTQGRKLYESLDMNPITDPATSTRLFPLVGARTIRCSCANSTYHSLQLEVNRQFASTVLGSMLVHGSYTWSHDIDNGSEAFATVQTASSFQSVPEILSGNSRIDRSDSDYDRRQRLVMDFVWEVRGPRHGWLGTAFGGWTLAGIPRWTSGAPFTVSNGTDRNGDGQTGPDRPDIGNASAPLNTRAVRIATSSCATGLANPDNNNACVSSNDVHWVEGSGSPTANTVRRNTLRSNGLDLFDATVIKRFSLTERYSFEYKTEVFNVFNTINFNGIPSATVNGSTSGSFLTFNQLNSVGRTMRMNLKFVF